MNTIKVVRSMLLRPIYRHRNAKKLAITSSDGIVEELYVTIGGIEQWITIRGEDRNNPVLFFLHGGPGAGQTVFNPLTRPWEKYFTLVQWDQRGSGKTLRQNGAPKPGELTLARLEKDGIEVVEYLRRHLNKEKIILAASSVGTTFGTAMAKHRPELFYAYVGTDQNTSPDAQKLSYELTLKLLNESGNKRGLKAVEKIGPDYLRWTRRQFDDFVQWALKANPDIPDMVMDVFFPAIMTSPGHTMRDIHDISEGINHSLDQLYDEMVTYDLRKLGTDFDLPFFIFQGDRDVVTPTASAREYFNEINAPHKEFVLIENSGHLAAFTRSEQFLQELITRVRPFATEEPVIAGSSG